MLNHPLLDQLDSSIRDRVPDESVEFKGEWTTSSRQAYKSEVQIGTGSGPFVEVGDFRWRGALTAAGPFSGIAFLHAAENLYRAKAPEVSTTLAVDVSLSTLARTNSAGFFVLLIPRRLLKMGRKRLWRLRDDVAFSLPPEMRDLLVHRRTGSIRSQPR